MKSSVKVFTDSLAEKRLRDNETSSGFIESLLQIVCDGSLDLPVRQAGALFFKNNVKFRWTNENPGSEISRADKELVKAGIVQAMITLPLVLQVQVGEAVTIIANSDFPNEWPSLVDDLVKNTSITDMAATNGVLHTAHSIFKRWRAQFRTDELFTEIAFVLSKFCEPFLDMVKQTDMLLEQNRDNRIALGVLFETLILLAKVFYDLNSQDIPEFFEDHMKDFMGVFHKYLTYSNAILEDSGDDVVPGPLERVKASICEIAELYTQRYEEIFTMLPDFVSSTWESLTRLSSLEKNDILVGKALSFLTCVVKRPRHASLFEAEQTLQQFIEKIVLPNMALRTVDEELFEDDPIEFTRRDLEGSNSDTRRRSATEFVRGLVEQFEQRMTTIVLQYVAHYLTLYAQDPVGNWVAKDTAMYLITSVTAQGVVTKNGVSSTNPMVDVIEFYRERVLSDLSTSSEVHPILKVDAIKYVYIFRKQLTRAHLVEVFPLLASHLNHENYVVSTYAAVTIDALLAAKTEGMPTFSKQDMVHIAGPLLESLFGLIRRGSTPEKMAENDFVMRCVMRVLLSAQDTVSSNTPVILGQLTEILAEVSKNPSNPQFNHYMFESIGAIVRHVGPISSTSLADVENLVMGPLLSVLQNDITEFTPYAFQLIAQMLEFQQGQTLPPSYHQLLKPILSPTLWDSRGNIPALVRLLQAFVSKSPGTIVASGYLEPVLGIFQKLIASKVNDVHGLDLMEKIYSNIDPQALSPYNQQIFLLLLTRLNSSRTEGFTLRFVVFLYYLSALQTQVGPDLIVSTVEAIQNGWVASGMHG